MTQTRVLLWSIPAVVYLLFCYWYTDFSGPLTAKEIEYYAARLAENGASPERVAQIRRFMEADTGRQLIMVNVIEMAPSPRAVDGAPAGATADDLLDRYMEYMYPALFKRACHPVFVGDAISDALDITGITGAEHWSRAALMRYRSRRDMLDISTNPAFSGRHEFKMAAMEKTIAFPVEAVLYASDPRVLLFVLLLAITAVSDIALHRRR